MGVGLSGYICQERTEGGYPTLGDEIENSCFFVPTEGTQGLMRLVGPLQPLLLPQPPLMPQPKVELTLTENPLFLPPTFLEGRPAAVSTVSDTACLCLPALGPLARLVSLRLKGRASGFIAVAHVNPLLRRVLCF